MPYLQNKSRSLGLPGDHGVKCYGAETQLYTVGAACCVKFDRIKDAVHTFRWATNTLRALLRDSDPNRAVRVLCLKKTSRCEHVTDLFERCHSRYETQRSFRAFYSEAVILMCKAGLKPTCVSVPSVKRNVAAYQIQTVWRKRRAAIFIQKIWRGYLFRKYTWHNPYTSLGHARLTNLANKDCNPSGALA